MIHKNHTKADLTQCNTKFHTQSQLHQCDFTRASLQQHDSQEPRWITTGIREMPHWRKRASPVTLDRPNLKEHHSQEHKVNHVDVAWPTGLCLTHLRYSGAEKWRRVPLSRRAAGKVDSRHDPAGRKVVSRRERWTAGAIPRGEKLSAGGKGGQPARSGQPLKLKPPQCH